MNENVRADVAVDADHALAAVKFDAPMPRTLAQFFHAGERSLDAVWEGELRENRITCHQSYIVLDQTAILRGDVFASPQYASRAP